MALKADETRRQWPRRLKIVFDFLNLSGEIAEQAKEFCVKARENSQWVNDGMMRFLAYQNQRVARGEISRNTIPNYYKAIKLFCEMNDLLLNWKKLSRVLPKRRNAANDRAPTTEELRRLIKYPDRRIKAIVCTMVSSGIRIWAWDDLLWKNVDPIHDEKGEIMAAKLTVYEGDAEEYYSFITPEAYIHSKSGSISAHHMAKGSQAKHFSCVIYGKRQISRVDPEQDLLLSRKN